MSRLLPPGSLKSKSNTARLQRSTTPKPTHFLCLPLVTPSSRLQLSTSVADSKADVVRPRLLGGFGLPPDAVRPVGTFHLTLGIMSFPMGKGLDKAIDLLRSLKPREILAQVKPPVISAGELPKLDIVVSLKGLRPMHKPGKTSVLYAPPLDPEDSLQGFAEGVAAHFKDAGLLVPENRSLLLHATIVNTRHVKPDKSKGKQRERAFITDAQAILDRYKSKLWIEAVPLRKIAICKMSAKPVEENGVVVDAEYEVEAELDLQGTP